MTYLPDRPFTMYFVRHGVTEPNFRGLRCGGDLDIPLMDIGCDQAYLLAKQIEKMNLGIGVIVAGSLIRTRQTASIISAVLGNVPVEVEPLVNERRLGQWNNRPIAETEAQLAARVTPPGGEPPGIESTPLFAVPVTDMPTAPFTIEVSRGILVPGAAGGGSAPFPRIVYVEAGEKIMCPAAGEGRVLYGPDGTVLASGGAEFAFPIGTACYTSPDSLDGIRNDGTDQGSILSFNLVPTPEETPTP